MSDKILANDYYYSNYLKIRSLLLFFFSFPRVAEIDLICGLALAFRKPKLCKRMLDQEAQCIDIQGGVHILAREIDNGSHCW